MKHKIEVGGILFYKAKFNRNEYEIKAVIVNKIGRKLFEVIDRESSSLFSGRKFSLEELLYEDKNYSQDNIQLYPSIQSIKDEDELRELTVKLRKLTAYNVDLTLDQMKRILAIFEEQTA